MAYFELLRSRRFHQLLTTTPAASMVGLAVASVEKTHKMPLRYARAIFEDRLASVSNNAFDDRVTLLCALSRDR
jgi:hypothetical protein